MSQTIYLLNDLPNNHTNNLLFQVTFSNIDQFRNYPITESNPNCFIQCLFALGLRNRHLANQPNKGVTLKAAQHYLSNIFGLPSKNIRYLGTNDIRNEPGGHDNTVANTQIREFLDVSLLENHATIIMLCFARYGKHTFAHYMIAYTPMNI